MKKHLTLAAAAALAVAAMGLNVRAADDAANTPNTNNPNALERTADRTGDALLRAGDKTKETLGIGDKPGATKHSEEINDVLAQVAEAAMTKSGLDDMVERFVDADRNRLGQNQDALKNNTALDGRIAQLQQDWKAKYGAEFDIKDEDAVYNGFAMINAGEIVNPARPAGEKIEGDAARTGANSSAAGNVGGVSGSANVNSDTGRANVDVNNNTGVDAPKANTDGQTAADKNLNDAGRNIATVTIAASHGMPEVKVPLIHEAGGWKLDIPDSVDAAKLRDNVQNALTLCDENKDKWPADANEAYRAVTHKVLLSIFDKPLKDDAQKASDSQPPVAAPAAPNPQ